MGDGGNRIKSWESSLGYTVRRERGRKGERRKRRKKKRGGERGDEREGKEERKEEEGKGEAKGKKIEWEKRICTKLSFIIK